MIGDTKILDWIIDELRTFFNGIGIDKKSFQVDDENVRRLNQLGLFDKVLFLFAIFAKNFVFFSQ